MLRKWHESNESICHVCFGNSNQNKLIVFSLFTIIYRHLLHQQQFFFRRYYRTWSFFMIISVLMWMRIFFYYSSLLNHITFLLCTPTHSKEDVVSETNKKLAYQVTEFNRNGNLNLLASQRCCNHLWNNAIIMWPHHHCDRSRALREIPNRYTKKKPDSLD